MIEYVIVRGATDRGVIGIVDNFASIIWESVYFGVGTFEIYAPVTQDNLKNLRIGNYVTRNERPRDVGIIESININYDVTGALMITATGRFAKSILDRRLIYNPHAVPGYTNLYRLTPVVYSGKVELAARSAVNSCIVNPTDNKRLIDFVKLGTLQNLPAVIVNETGKSQTTYDNLLSFTDGLLQDCNYSAYMSLDNETGNLLYNVYEGADKSETMKFSQELDNLIKSNYSKNAEPLKTIALVGGSGEGAARYFVTIDPDEIIHNAGEQIPNEQTGINRREIFVDGKDIQREYEEGQYYPMSEYAPMLKTLGLTELKTNHIVLETYNGEIDITANNYILGVDYNVGDIVLLQDKTFNYIQKQRIYKATEVQDENGYNVTISFDNK